MLDLFGNHIVGFLMTQLISAMFILLSSVGCIWINQCSGTHFRMKQRQEEEDQRYKDDMQRKMDMLLKLKGDITVNRVIVVIRIFGN